MMQASAGFSRSEDARTCAVEASVAARSGLDGEPVSLAVVFASSEFAPAAEAVLDGVYEATTPDVLIGCVADGIVAGDTEIESGPAVSVWTASLPSTPEAFHTQLAEGPDIATLQEPGSPVLAAPGDRRFIGWRPGSSHLLLCDPFTFPVDVLLRTLAEEVPGARVMGGLASGARSPGQTRLFLNREVVRSGAVGVAFGDDVEVVPLVSQGCRPVGRPMTVTGADRNLVTELAGRSPVERVKEVFEDAPIEDQELMRRGLLVGCVIDEHKVEPEVGDFLIRTVVGADPESGAIAMGDLVKVGQTIQFHVRDEASAHQDLQDGLKRLRDRLPEGPAGALLFTCNGRGSNLFSEPDHDAKAVARELDDLPLAGFFAGGEIGPVGSRNFLHGFTASMAVVRARSLP